MEPLSCRSAKLLVQVTTDADQSADRDRRELGVGLSRDDVLLVSLSLLRSSVLRRPVSRQFHSRVGFSVTHHSRARLSGHTLGELCHGIQAWRSVRNISRRRLGVVFRRLLSHAVVEDLRWTKARQYLVATSDNSRSRWYPASPDRRSRTGASHAAAFRAARILSCATSLLAVGFWPGSAPRQA